MRLCAVPDATLDQILSGVSRSFYLSLAVLPRPMRLQLSVAYLIARAADTIADTRAIDAPHRLELLGELRSALRDPTRIVPVVGGVRRQLVDRVGDAIGAPLDAERTLLERLGDCLRILARCDEGDRARSQKVLDTLITGMERDLTRFPTELKPGESPVMLATLAELDEHCYLAAGCVGEYWTLMSAAHVPSVERLARPDFVARGVRLGKALQLVNVIRDAPVDLAQGRCYWPHELLERHQLGVEDLIDPVRRSRARAASEELCALALAHVDAAFPYVMAIPRRQSRLRLAALWPLWIGLGTLELLKKSADPLDPAHPVKIDRKSVYRILTDSSLVVGSDQLLTARHRARRARAAD